MAATGDEAGSVPELYVPLSQFPSAQLDLVVQTDGSPLGAAAPVQYGEPRGSLGGPFLATPWLSLGAAR
jgi:hypothetical protein